MLFSILIPVYNVEKYLAECIDSVLNQDEQDFEIILCDDGSTDNSGNICDLYAQKYSQKIKVIHKKNEGLLLTRRCLIKNAKGQWIIFVDSDDLLIKNALKILKKNIIKYNCDLILYNLERIKLNGKNNVFNLDLKENFIYTDNNKKEVYLQLLKNNNLNSLCTKAVKKELFDINEDYSKYIEINIGEDLFQSLPLLENAQKILYIDKVLYTYIKREDSMTYTLPINILMQRKILWKRLDYYFNIWNFDDMIIEKIYISRFKQIINCLLELKKSKIQNQYLYEFIKDFYFIDLIKKTRNNKLNFCFVIYKFLLLKKNILLLNILLLTENLFIRLKNKI